MRTIRRIARLSDDELLKSGQWLLKQAAPVRILGKPSQIAVRFRENLISTFGNMKLPPRFVRLKKEPA